MDGIFGVTAPEINEAVRRLACCAIRYRHEILNARKDAAA